MAWPLGGWQHEYMQQIVQGVAGGAPGPLTPERPTNKGGPPKISPDGRARGQAPALPREAPQLPQQVGQAAAQGVLQTLGINTQAGIDVITQFADELGVVPGLWVPVIRDIIRRSPAGTVFLGALPLFVAARNALKEANSMTMTMTKRKKRRPSRMTFWHKTHMKKKRRFRIGYYNYNDA